MAYNSGFPMAYQPYYPMQNNSYPNQMAVTPSQPTQNNGIIWVQGEAGAKSYLVAPNNTVQLWDSESQTIYLKSADASGMPTMKILDYSIRDNTVPNATPVAVTPVNDYVTREEFNIFVEKFNHFADVGKKNSNNNNKGGKDNE